MATEGILGPVKLRKSFKFDKLDCSNHRLNSWLFDQALQWQADDGRAVFVLISEHAEVKAYYSLAVGEVSDLTSDVEKAVRLLLVNRMGISRELDQETIAEHLLRGILIKAARASNTADIKALVVKASDEKLVPLYARLGFVGFSQNQFGALLVKSMKTIRAEAWMAGHID